MRFLVGSGTERDAAELFRTADTVLGVTPTRSAPAFRVTAWRNFFFRLFVGAFIWPGAGLLHKIQSLISLWASLYDLAVTATATLYLLPVFSRRARIPGTP